jgi:SAM-dependent methyltransferase
VLHKFRKIAGHFPLVGQIFALKIYVRRYTAFLYGFYKFRSMSVGRKELQLVWRDRYPCLNDNTGTTGFDRHYVFHTAWAARVLAELKSVKHVDISSSLYFCSIASAFVPVDFYDYRPAELNLSNLNSRAGDLLQLPFADNAVASLSCMHVVEHVGLGRYGDPMDADGDLKAIDELKRVLAVDGTLLFVVPVGRPRIMFNAHRIYSFEQIIGYFASLELVEFSLIPDNEGDGGLIRNADPTMVKNQSYACGCFRFKKPCVS